MGTPDTLGATGRAGRSTGEAQPGTGARAGSPDAGDEGDEAGQVQPGRCAGDGSGQFQSDGGPAEVAPTDGMPEAETSAAVKETRADLARPTLSSEELEHVLRAARGLVSHRRVKVGNGPAVRVDCSGFVRAVFRSIGLDVFAQGSPAVRQRHGNGVGLLLWFNESHGAFWPREGPAEGYAVTPLPGDIVYFHDTYDRNRNRRYDDRFTHVGLVESVSGDGTVTFLHAAGHVVRRERMNLRRPHVAREGGEVVNHPVRYRTRWERPGDPRLASELFAGFGRLARPPALAAFSPERALPVLPAGGAVERSTRRRAAATKSTKPGKAAKKHGGAGATSHRAAPR